MLTFNLQSPSFVSLVNMLPILRSHSDGERCQLFMNEAGLKIKKSNRYFQHYHAAKQSSNPYAFRKHMDNKEKGGGKQVDMGKYMLFFTLLLTEMQNFISKPNFSHQQLLDTNQQQAALRMNCDKVLFFFPLPLSSVFREH